MTATPPSLRQALLIRTFDPTPAAARRLARWAKACHTSGGLVDVVVQIDCTRQARQSSVARRACKRRRIATSESSATGATACDKEGRCGGFGAGAPPPAVSPTRRIMRALAEQDVDHRSVQIHRYTEDDMTRAFPHLIAMRRLLVDDMRIKEIASGKCSLAWSFHAEALMLWWRQSKVDYNFVWRIEDDVGIAGGTPVDLAHAYARAEPTADLITQNLRDVSRTWHWRDVHTGEAFLQAVDQKRMANREHIQRFSRKMFQVLDGLVSRGVTAWSEMFIPSVAQCKSRHGLRAVELWGCSVGEIFRWDGRITSAEEWRVIDNKALARVQEEQRTDASCADDGNAFTKAEFEAFYGSTKEWDAAPPADPEKVAACSIKLYHALKW